MIVPSLAQFQLGVSKVRKFCVIMHFYDFYFSFEVKFCYIFVTNQIFHIFLMILIKS